MKLDRLKLFVDELTNDAIVGRLTSTTETFYFFDNGWHELSGPIDPAVVKVAELNRTRRIKSSWRPKGSLESFFFVEQLDAVVRGRFQTVTTAPTRAYFDLALKNCFRHAQNAFRASYDSLTELLNRESFSNALSVALAAPPSIGSPTETAFSAGSQVALVALDIDHFKQLNDTYGHAYGDLVLRSFSRRLERIVAELRTGSSGKSKFHICRPGGEEFSVVIEGDLTNDEVCRMASAIQSGIGRASLPSDEEWAGYSSLGQNVGLTLPPDRERTVTCSVGVSTVSLPVGSSSIERHKADLINQADLALYKAKAAGRNTVCFFPDILQRYGRVLEYHPETERVVIDLGTEVGLRPGQELLVYHPDFAGTKDYVFRDGRTSKKLGVYPRVPSARLVAFDVQKEVAFCNVMERRPESAAVVERASLEAIPLGSISHLVGTGTHWEGPPPSSPSGVGTIEQIQSEVDRLAKAGSSPFVAAFRIEDESSIVEKIGSAAVNRALAALYESCRSLFPSGAVVSALRATEYAVALSDSTERAQGARSPYHELVLKVLSRANEAAAGRFQFVAGEYDGPWLESRIESRSYEYDRSMPKPERALALARYVALVEGEERTAPSISASPNTLGRFFGRQLKERKFVQTYEDYKAIRDAGFVNAFIENCGAQCAYQIGEIEVASDSMKRAIELNPSKPMFRANYGLVLYKLGKFQEAAESFETALRMEEGFQLPDSYYGIYAYSMYAAHQAGVRTKSLSAMEGAIQRALDLEVESFVDRSELSNALSAVQELIRAEASKGANG